MPAEKKRVALVPQREQLTSMPSRLCQKEKKQSHLSKTPNRDAERSQGEREPDLGEREGDQSGSMKGKGWTQSEGSFQGGEGG